MIEDHLKLKPEQTERSSEQQAEAQRFAAERIATQLSTTPVDEQEAPGGAQLIRVPGKIAPAGVDPGR